MFKFGTLSLVLLIPIYSYSFAPFSVLDKTYNKSLEATEFNQIPPYKTQDGLGTCSSSTAAAYLDMIMCRQRAKTEIAAKRESKDYNACEGLKDDQAFSRLATGKFAGISFAGSSEEDYKGLFPEEGYNPTNILKNILDDSLCPPTEACASLDKALTNFNDSIKFNEAKQAIFEKLQNKYAAIKKGCASCPTITAVQEEEIRQMSNQLGLQSNIQNLQLSTATTFSLFLEKVLMPNQCLKENEKKCYKGPSKVEEYPKISGSNMSDVLGQIKSVLKTNTPVILNSICRKKSGKCDTNDPALHTLIVTGYRKICKPNPSDSSKQDCKDSLRVYNSYGATWQQQNDNGWLDAKALLDSTEYKAGTLTWISSGNAGSTASL